MATSKNVRLRIKRQDGPRDPSYWQDFEVPWQPQMNVISALMEIQKRPRTASGQKVAPVVWDCSCLEEVCGACTMLVNGRVRQSCSALVDRIAPNGETIELAPMTKFPVVRDLVVDRARMFEDLKRVKAWVHLDGSNALGAGPRQSQDNQETAYPLSRCMTCGC
jgi:succinate dehydrogenase / fumarate reductase, iron-sulfur subunit